MLVSVVRNARLVKERGRTKASWSERIASGLVLCVVQKNVRDRKDRRGGFDGLIDFRAGVERPDRCQRVDFRPAVGPAREAK